MTCCEVYLVSKPIQYVNCLGVMKTKSSNVRNVLFILQNFNDSEESTRKINNSNIGWDSVISVVNRSEFISQIKKLNPTRVYVDNDLHKFGRLLTTVNAKITVYEEGWGTYRESLNDVTSSTLKNTFIRMLSFMGYFNDFHGGNVNTSEILVYDKAKYASVHPEIKVLPFSETLSEVITTYFEHFKSVFMFEEEIFEGSFYFLMTPNIINNQVLATLEKLSSLNKTYVKLHPNLKKLPIKNENLVCLKGTYPSEILIAKLLGNKKLIKIYHHNSSSVMYFKAQSELFENYSRDPNQFNGLLNL